MLERILPEEVSHAFSAMSKIRRAQVIELRFRMGQPVAAGYPWGEALLDGGKPLIVTEAMLRELLNRATGYSPYALKAEEMGLYLPLEGGCRMGLCGEVVVEQGKLRGLRHISSAVIRFAREVPGVADEGVSAVLSGGRPESALIVSPPGVGKTTYLRDLVRQISMAGWRVCVADERREIAGATKGFPTLDVGPRTDVLSGCPKGEAVPLLLRVMNPQVVAVDEIVGQQELDAVHAAAFSGVAVLATAHGKDFSDLMRKPMYRKLLTEGVFSYGIVLTGQGKVQIERLGVNAETGRSMFCGNSFPDERLGRRTGTSSAAPGAASASAGSGADAGGNGAAYALSG
ncbi:MAG: stage III sporulation protein AB [Oscillospiraceae bacterium]|nr:stage III sporulation protein AB [Oscillospiraceae bacterium]